MRSFKSQKHSQQGASCRCEKIANGLLFLCWYLKSTAATSCCVPSVLCIHSGQNKLSGKEAAWCYVSRKGLVLVVLFLHCIVKSSFAACQTVYICQKQLISAACEGSMWAFLCPHPLRWSGRPRVNHCAGKEYCLQTLYLIRKEIQSTDHFHYHETEREELAQVASAWKCNVPGKYLSVYHALTFQTLYQQDGPESKQSRFLWDS